MKSMTFNYICLALLVGCQSKEGLIEKKQKALNLHVEHIERHEDETRYHLVSCPPELPPTYPWNATKALK